MTKDTWIGVGIIGISAIVVLGIVGMAVAQPYFEAKAFNNCTGGHATYFTAMFTELRVQECNK